MSVTDPLADALTVLRNAYRAKKETTEIRASTLIGQVLEILKREGFVKDFRFADDKKQGFFRVHLKYQRGKIPAITGIRKVSKSSRRCYVKGKEVAKVYGGLGVAILSTSKKLLTDNEARSQNIGGELLCEVW